MIPSNQGPVMNLDNQDEPLTKYKAIMNMLFWGGLFLSMLIGMFAKSLYSNSQDNQSLEFRLDILMRPETIRPVLISPIVFGVIYALGKSMPRNFGTFLFAFQNGFFWKAVVGDISQQPEYSP